MKKNKKVVPFFKPSIDDEDIKAVTEVMKSGWLSMGEKTMEFERELCKTIGAKNCIVVNSGTSALHLILDSLGIKEGDEVIIPANTFIATSEAVEYLKASPVLADIEKDTFNISPDDIITKITPRTKAIIPVHIAGQSCKMEEINDIAERYKLKIVDDAAHSLPTKYKDKMIGTVTEASAFSFYATKPLMTGEGGMVSTNNDQLAEIIRLKRLHGINKDAWNRYSEKGKWAYDVKTLGYKYNPMDISSALGLTQLKKLNSLYNGRKKIAERYNTNFKNCELLETPFLAEYSTHSWHLYIIKLQIEKLNISRDEMIEKLLENGIHPSVHFIPLYKFSHFSGKYKSDDFPNTEDNFKRIISLPLYPSMENEEADYVSEVVIKILREHKK